MEGVLGPDLKGVDVLGIKIFGQRLILNNLGVDIHTRRVGAATLVTARIGSIDQGVVGEGQVRFPVQHEAAGHRPPGLLDIGLGRVALTDIAAGLNRLAAVKGRPHQQLAGIGGRDLLIVGITQTHRQAQIGTKVPIALAEDCPGADFHCVLAAEVVVAVTRQLTDRRPIDVNAFLPAGHVGAVAILRHQTLSGRHIGVNIVEVFGNQTEKVIENVVVILGLEIEVIGAKAEVEISVVARL